MKYFLIKYFIVNFQCSASPPSPPRTCLSAPSLMLCLICSTSSPSSTSSPLQYPSRRSESSRLQLWVLPPNPPTLVMFPMNSRLMSPAVMVSYHQTSYDLTLLIQFFSWTRRSRCLWPILAKSPNLRVDWSWNIQCWRRINATNWVRPKQCQPHWHSADTGDGQQRRAQRRHGHAVTTPDPLLLSTTLFLSILPCHSVLAVVNGIIIFDWKISAELLIPRRLKTKLLPTLQIWSSLLMILMSFLLIKGKIYILAWALIYILLMISTGCFYYSWYIILL